MRVYPNSLSPCWTTVCLIVVLCWQPAFAQDISLHGALTTDYVYRGVSNSDEHGAVQAAIDLETASGVFAGIWASTTDLVTGNRYRPREVDYYLGYVRYFGNDWSATVSVNRYSYPGDRGNVDYDYTEYAAILGYDDRIWLEYNHTNALFGHDSTARNVELLSSWPLGQTLSLSAGLGYFDVSDAVGSGYWYWQAGVTRPFGWLEADIRYHDTASVPMRFVADRLVDPRLVLTLSVQY